MLKNSVPRVSLIPRWKPLLENGWHGNPAASTSWSGTCVTVGSVSGITSPSTNGRPARGRTCPPQFRS